MFDPETEWGPARNNPDSPYHRGALAAQDPYAGGQLPDDN